MIEKDKVVGEIRKWISMYDSSIHDGYDVINDILRFVEALPENTDSMLRICPRQDAKCVYLKPYGDGAIGLCSVPDGPPSDLEAEVNRYYRDKTKPNCVSVIPFEALAEIARHFADWQADNMVRWQKGIGPSNSMIGSLMLSAYNQGRMDEMMASGMKQKQQEKKWYETTTA